MTDTTNTETDGERHDDTEFPWFDDDGAARVAASVTGEPHPEGVREETLRGTDYLVVPTVAVVEGVAEDRFLPFEEIARAAPAWNGRPLTATHPTDADGEFRTANTPRTLEEHGIGRFLNVEADPDTRRLTGELWINLGAVDHLIDAKGETGLDAMQTVERVEAGEPVEVSPGFRCATLPTPGEFDGTPYSEVIIGVRPDHLAVLPFTEGARNGDPAAILHDATTAPEPVGDRERKRQRATLSSRAVEAARTADDYGDAVAEAVDHLQAHDLAGFMAVTLREDWRVGIDRPGFGFEDPAVGEQWTVGYSAGVDVDGYPIERAALFMLLGAVTRYAQTRGATVDDVLESLGKMHRIAESKATDEGGV